MIEPPPEQYHSYRGRCLLLCFFIGVVPLSLRAVIRVKYRPVKVVIVSPYRTA